MPPSPLVSRTHLQSKDDIEAILDDRIMSMKDGGERNFLVNWLYRPKEDATWILQDELQQLNPRLYKEYIANNSMEPNFPERRVDADSTPFRTFVLHRCHKPSIWLDDVTAP